MTESVQQKGRAGDLQRALMLIAVSIELPGLTLKKLPPGLLNGGPRHGFKSGVAGAAEGMVDHREGIIGHP